MFKVYHNCSIFGIFSLFEENKCWKLKEMKRLELLFSWFLIKNMWQMSQRFGGVEWLSSSFSSRDSDWLPTVSKLWFLSKEFRTWDTLAVKLSVLWEKRRIKGTAILLPWQSWRTMHIWGNKAVLERSHRKPDLLMRPWGYSCKIQSSSNRP